jgi:glycerophosphoryl diester phosphodiesterase
MPLNTPSWLTSKPIAHRGLHDCANGVVENTLGAAEAAVALGFSIECDVQMSADGEAVVFHDETLERLMAASGPLSAMTAREIGNLRFRDGDETIPTFATLLQRIADRTAVICEIKSAFDGDMRLTERTAEIAGGYPGRLALKSFDPAIIAYLRARAERPGPAGAPCPLGMVAEASYDGEYWAFLAKERKVSFANFLHYRETRPDFLSYCVDDLPNATPFLLRTLDATPVMAWTVRTQAQRRTAAQWADQIVFEGEISA